MPTIGETLREARMRQRLDIADVERQTKIRAKYLRALENEEFSMLPGPTFVKTFLRTYAELLGLDPHALVEQYRVGAQERLDESGSGEHRELPVLERPQVLGADLRLPLDIGDVEVLTHAGLAQRLTDGGHRCQYPTISSRERNRGGCAPGSGLQPGPGCLAGGGGRCST